VSEERIFVVDRIEGRHIVLIGDDESEVALTRPDIPLRVREGTVLRVTMVGDDPVWATARRDAEEEQRRLEDLERRMNDLRSRDPGGDLAL
jgi:hypothetical protein